MATYTPSPGYSFDPNLPIDPYIGGFNPNEGMRYPVGQDGPYSFAPPPDLPGGWRPSGGSPSGPIGGWGTPQAPLSNLSLSKAGSGSGGSGGQQVGPYMPRPDWRQTRALNDRMWGADYDSLKQERDQERFWGGEYPWENVHNEAAEQSLRGSRSKQMGNMNPYATMGNRMWKRMHEAQTVPGFDKRMGWIRDSNVMKEVHDMKRQELEGSLAARGLNRSGHAMNELSELPIEIAMGIENQLYDRTANMVDIGFDAAGKQADIWRHYGDQSAGLSADRAAGIRQTNNLNNEIDSRERTGDLDRALREQLGMGDLELREMLGMSDLELRRYLGDLGAQTQLSLGALDAETALALGELGYLADLDQIVSRYPNDDEEDYRYTNPGPGPVGGGGGGGGRDRGPGAGG